MFLKKLIILSVLAFTSSNCSNILFIIPPFAKSHVVTAEVLGKALAQRGHKLTFVTAFPSGKNIENFQEVKIMLNNEDLELLDEINKAMSTGKEISNMLATFSKIIFDIGNQTLQSAEVRDLMDNKQFDLMILGYFMNDFALGLADHFKCPSIVYFSGHLLPSLSRIVGSPLAPETVPHTMIKAKTMDFTLRIKNLLLNAVDLLMQRFYFYPKARVVYDKHFPADRYRSYDEMIRNVSLILVNTHFSSSGPRPLLPNLVEVGGIQVNPEPAPLPDDIKKFLDEAKDGAILFSFGSNAKSIYLPEDKQKVLLKVFSKLKMRVIMKWESDELPGKPSNVLISKWLPQNDILAHPNIKAFISHCGYGGVVEAKFNGVPIIGIPLGADQKGNAAKIVEEGWAIRLDLSDMTEENLMAAIKEIINNKKYGDIVKKEAILSKDRPLNAQETAVYWVEYVLRHRGAPHLHYPGADLNFFQANSIDVMLFIVAVIYAVFKVIKLFCGFLCCRHKRSDEKLKIN